MAKKSEVVEEKVVEKVVEKKSLIAQLEEEGDIAADYLEGLLDDKSNDEGGTTITENPTDIGGQRKQPKRKKKKR